MATAILTRRSIQPALDPEVFALAEEIADEQGVGFRLGLVLAELQLDDLTAYAQAWDAAARAQQARCPVCGARIEGRQYYVGGRGYCDFDVCSGDGSHSSRRV